MKIYKLPSGTLLNYENQAFLGPVLDWDSLLAQENLQNHIISESKSWKKISSEEAEAILAKGILAPMGNQEIWAAGVTYFRSRTARMEESQDAGGADFTIKYTMPIDQNCFSKLLPAAFLHQDQESISERILRGMCQSRN